MKNRPIKKFKASNIEVAIWENTRKVKDGEVSFKTISLTRNWKKKDDDVWRSDVINLRRGDIAKVMVVLNKAQEELFLNQQVEEEE